jgi:hypothetical protein
VKKDIFLWLCWCCFSRKYFTCWWNRPNGTTSNTWTDKPDLAASCLTVHFQTWWLSLPYLCRWNTTWKAQYMTAGLDWDLVTHSVLQGDHETRQMFTRTALFALCTETRPRQRLWNHLWHTEPVFDKFCNSSEHLAVDKAIVTFKGRVSSGSVFPRTENFSASKFTKCVMNQGIHMIKSVLAQTVPPPCPPTDDMTATHTNC